MSSKDNNPRNFANRPHEKVVEAARKGGHASHSGGFASMDAEKQHDIASKGGHASTGQFEAGSERAREASRKGGRASGDGGGGGGSIDDDEADAGDNTQHSRIE